MFEPIFVEPVHGGGMECRALLGGDIRGMPEQSRWRLETR
jgi:hypothetical protein